MPSITVSRAESGIESGLAKGRHVVDNRGLAALGRTGWVAKGIVYLLIGVLAFSIAAEVGIDSGSGGGESADRQGALQAFADVTGGGAALIALAVGLFLYSLWRVTTAALPSDDSGLKVIGRRIGYLVSAGIYGLLGWSALSIATTGSSGGGGTGGGGGGSQSTVEKWTRDLMEMTGGRWIVGAVGVGACALGAYYAYQGVEKKFTERLDLAAAGPTERKVLERTGMAGWIGRGGVAALIGVFLVWAAVSSDPDEARGLDAALREASENTLGTVLVIITAVGLVLYGVYCIISSRRRILTGP